MASIDDLKSAVKETLERRGTLNQVKARIRAEVFKALDDQSEPRPPLTSENLLIIELMREFLEFNGYMYTSSVMQAETGHMGEPLDRNFLAQELNVLNDRNSSSVPLLYGIIAHFLKRKRSGSPERSRSPQRSSRSPPRST